MKPEWTKQDDKRLLILAVKAIGIVTVGFALIELLDKYAK